MLDIHNANLSFWSPMPQFIGGFFFPQQLFQLAWLYRLYKLDSKKPVERTELDQIGRLSRASLLVLNTRLTGNRSRFRALLCPRQRLHRQYVPHLIPALDGRLIYP